MKYQVKLENGNLGIVDETILETESRKEAFEKMGYAKKHEYEAPFNNFDCVKVYENGEWIARAKLGW